MATPITEELQEAANSIVKSTLTRDCRATTAAAVMRKAATVIANLVNACEEAWPEHAAAAEALDGAAAHRHQEIADVLWDAVAEAKGEVQ